MANETDNEAALEEETQTEGAMKAGNGNYFFDIHDDENAFALGSHYSTAHGPVIEGERMQVGLVHKSAGSGSRLHKHPNEQFNYVVQGTLRVKIEDNEEYPVQEGQVAYIPPDTEHYSMAGKDEDCYFYVVKDTSHLIYGDPIDDSIEEAQYDDGYEPDE
ncbi:MAG: cupin domain-containing protein [Halobacteriota archaeon]